MFIVLKNTRKDTKQNTSCFLIRRLEASAPRVRVGRISEEFDLLMSECDAERRANCPGDRYAFSTDTARCSNAWKYSEAEPVKF